MGLKRSIIKVRFMTADKLRHRVKNPKTGAQVSAETIRRALEKVGAISVRVRKGQFLTAKHKERRVEFAEKHIEEDTDFATWTFSDEKWWRVGGVKGNERIWVDITDQDPDERYIPTQAQPAKVMVWGAISYHGRTGLHFFDGSVDSETYQTAIEQAYLPACFEEEWLALSESQEYTFQQDGARCHTSKSSTEWLHENLPEGITLLEKEDWPANSPDLSPIERLWAILQNIVVEEQAWTQEKLIQVVDREWWKIPQSTIQKLFDSMPNRLSKCIGAEGGRFRL
jgi:arginine repressor